MGCSHHDPASGGRRSRSLPASASNDPALNVVGQAAFACQPKLLYRPRRELLPLATRRTTRRERPDLLHPRKWRTEMDRQRQRQNVPVSHSADRAIETALAVLHHAGPQLAVVAEQLELAGDAVIVAEARIH